MLHDVVDDVKNGTYGVTGSGDCGGATIPGRTQHRTVIIIGHSAGGWVVAGYPGQYHDVAAMIQADIPASSAGCDVSQLLLPDTAHLFMVHRSLPTWVDYVVNWLAAHGLAGTP